MQSLIPTPARDRAADQLQNDILSAAKRTLTALTTALSSLMEHHGYTLDWSTKKRIEAIVGTMANDSSVKFIDVSTLIDLVHVHIGGADSFVMSWKVASNINALQDVCNAAHQVSTRATLKSENKTPALGSVLEPMSDQLAIDGTKMTNLQICSKRKIFRRRPRGSGSSGISR